MEPCAIFSKNKNRQIQPQFLRLNSNLQNLKNTPQLTTLFEAAIWTVYLGLI